MLRVAAGVAPEAEPAVAPRQQVRVRVQLRAVAATESAAQVPAALAKACAWEVAQRAGVPRPWPRPAVAAVKVRKAAR